MNKLLVNALLFQAGWFACVFAAGQPWLLLVPLAALLVHFLWTSSWAAEGRLVISVMLIGCVLDSFLLNLGVLDFGTDSLLLPVWMAAYKYSGKSYRFVVNGQTGEVQGERPYSWWKIGLTVLLVAALVAGAVYLNDPAAFGGSAALPDWLD